jgi:hypothetical protein
MTLRENPRAFYGLVLAAGFMLALVGLTTAAPPPDSPIARGEHPRLFLTASELPVLRDRIAKHYRGEFQDFINLLNDPGSKVKGEDWGALNYAFVALLDPGEMKAQGFSFSSALDSAEKYCAKAAGYAKTQLSKISGAARIGHGGLTQGFPTAVYIPVMAVYDWCHSHLAEVDKRAIVDAFISAYEKKWKDVSSLKAYGRNRGMLANNQETIYHETLGILAFFNDAYPSPELQAKLYEVFNNVWINRILVEINYFYRHGTGWHEGPGGYIRDGILNVGFPVSMFSSALGTDFVGTTPFFTTYPLFVAANVKPYTQLISKCGPTGNQKCTEFFERWGVIGGGISNISYGAGGCKAAALMSGLLRKSNHPNASLGKWVHRVLPEIDCQAKVIANHGGPWTNAVLYWFLHGDKETVARTPTESGAPASVKLGLGQYVMRSGYESDSSQVVFWATPWGMYGHAPATQGGQFTLHKFGNLILHAANGKSGMAEIRGAGANVFRNIIGIHKGASDPDLNFDGEVVDTFWNARGIRIKDTGKLLTEDINNGRYDYIALDVSSAWRPATADLVQREFVYLRGPLNKEFVVVLDRVKVKSPSANEKIWKIWVPNQPVLENGSLTNPRPGKWVSTNTDIVSMTNKFPSSQLEGKAASTHGKFYMKILAPQSRLVNVLGGPGKEYQSGDDDGTTPGGAPSMSQFAREHLGWGRIEVRPTQAANYDVFLNVIQFGDADTLTSMSPVVSVNSSEGRHIGAQIKDVDNPWILVFAKTLSDPSTGSSFNYTFDPSSSTSKHLLMNMKPSSSYYVRLSTGANGNTVSVSTVPQADGTLLSSNHQGVLLFTVSGNVVDKPSPVTTGRR